MLICPSRVFALIALIVELYTGIERVIKLPYLTWSQSLAFRDRELLSLLPREQKDLDKYILLCLYVKEKKTLVVISKRPVLSS